MLSLEDGEGSGVWKVNIDDGEMAKQQVKAGKGDVGELAKRQAETEERHLAKKQVKEMDELELAADQGELVKRQVKTDEVETEGADVFAKHEVDKRACRRNSRAGDTAGQDGQGQT